MPRVLHLSFHYGCASDLNYVFKALGWDIDFFDATCWSSAMTERLAHEIWQTHKDRFQSYDLIVTSDTAALSYPFLLHYDELRPRLLIWVCNRFNICMEKDALFHTLFRETRATKIPYTAFETEWCRRFKIDLKHPVIPPLGRHEERYICNPAVMERIFRPLERFGPEAPDTETVFVHDYHNNAKYLVPFLRDRGFSVAWGRYTDLAEIKGYKAVVSLPDAFCKIFHTEAIQHGIPVLLPSLRGMKHLFNAPGYGFTSREHISRDDLAMCAWLEHPECHILFDSMEDIPDLLAGLTPDHPVHAAMAATRDLLEARVLAQWRAASTRRVALVQKGPIHSEVFGPFLHHYAGRQDVVVHVYANPGDTCVMWDLFRAWFGAECEVRDVATYDAGAYDAVVLVTSDEWRAPPTQRHVLAVHHDAFKHRRDDMPNFCCLAPFCGPERWLFPLYPMPPASPPAPNDSSVCIIGVVTPARDVEDIVRYLERGGVVHAFGRHAHQAPNHPGLVGHWNLPSAELVARLSEIPYAWFPVHRASAYAQSHFTGGLALAVNSNKRMIMPRFFAALYGLEQCVLTYETSICELDLATVSEGRVEEMMHALVAWKEARARANERLLRAF